ncbi:DUF1707 domain-containing protein [Streptomyces sp. NPDC006798]|uniref:DUF1707 SHOCT-like domain-containing protein n=1 Tax=Streptomyces sp. NPDC006798 TaxID=3155462 RepID=UPI0033D35CF7
MTSPPEDLQRRIREADREAAVQRLQEAYAEGQLTHEEMDQRLDGVLTASTRGDLEAVLAVLPPEEPGTVAEIGAAGGRIRRTGAWKVPRTLKVASAFGRVRLDLSRAVIDHPVIDIELQIGTGSARITVPRDAVVDLGGLTTGWKDVRYKPRAAKGKGPTIRITGAMGMGRLKIRHAFR